MVDDRSGSGSGGDESDVDAVALRTALSHSRLDQGGGSSQSDAPSAFASRRSAGNVAGPSRPARSTSGSAARSAPLQVRRPPATTSIQPSEGIHRHRWVLVPSPAPGRSRMPESEVQAARRERQRAREALVAGDAFARRRAIARAPVDPEDALIASVLRRSLTTAESDARRLLRRKNAKAIRLAIELSEREASTKAKARRHTQEQERLLRRLAGVHMELSDDSDDGSNSDDDDADSPTADAYTDDQSSTTDSKGKAAARKW